MPTFHNKTRTSRSIPSRLAAEGRWYLVPVYYLMLSSDLAREGIENSGSYHFADHIYANRPGGRFGIGVLLDAILLNLVSARSLRARCQHAKREIAAMVAREAGGPQLRVLSVPCGLARELFESAAELWRSGNSGAIRVQWIGMDLDSELVAQLNGKVASPPWESMQFVVGDALTAGDHWGSPGYDMIISTGFTEFLDDAQTLAFYTLALQHLRPGGVLVTSGLDPHKISDYLLRNVGELHTHYRSSLQLEALVRQAGFRSLRTYRDHLLTMLVAGK